MSKIPLKTEKLYLGYPIFILGYKDEKWGYNYTTCSSSYTLGNQMNIGLSKQSKAVKQIAKHGSFTLNIPTQEHLQEIIVGGFNSGGDKFHMDHSFTYERSEYMDAPIISEACLTLECTVQKVIEHQQVCHIFSSIERWLVEEKLVSEGHLDIAQFNPVFYMGDSYERKCRFLSDGIHKLGE